MPGEYKIDYQAVYAITANLKKVLAAGVNQVEQDYKKAESDLDILDSATNALLQVTMRRNKEKTLVTFEIMEKMLSFIDDSAHI
ncbi:MAG: hypothetical protein LBH28_02760, partial [Oscillospiraceae bacterium]|nr:hypothetical protein [Oscillospiraceae bacterium]